jgi:protocatechuate 3,4-dioxygenase beta subunit
MRAIAAFALVAFLHQAGPPQPQPAPQPGTAVVSGQVLDATANKPVGGVTVMFATGAPPAVLDSGTQVPPPARTRAGMAITNAQGRFVFRNVPAGTLSLIAIAEGFAPGDRTSSSAGPAAFAVADGACHGCQRSDLAIMTISGFVRDDRGQPVVGVPVWGMRRSMSGGRMNVSLTGGQGESTDDRGFYRISGLMPGSYVVAIRLSTHAVSIATSDAYKAAVASGTTSTITGSWPSTGALGIEGGGIIIDDFQARVPSGQPPLLPGPNNTLLVHPAALRRATGRRGDRHRSRRRR